MGLEPQHDDSRISIKQNVSKNRTHEREGALENAHLTSFTACDATINKN